MYYFIVNPVAQQGKARQKWEQYLPLLKKELGNIDFDYTQHKGHATILCQEAIQKGYRTIIAVGGDGTLHEVINGTMQQSFIATSEITHFILPLGTGNDWIKTQQIPRKIIPWIQKVKTANTHFHDIGKIEYQDEKSSKTHYFINVAGMAYDGYVGKVIHETPSAVKSKWLYLYEAVRLLFTYQPTLVTVFVNERDITNAFYLINIGIAKFSGGGMQLVPYGEANNGLFSVTLVKKMSKWRALASIPSLFNGKLDQHSLAETFQTEEINITAPTPNYLEADGEYLGTTPVNIRIIPKAIKIIH